MESNWNGRDDEAPKQYSPAPWDEPPEGDPEPARPARHDAFTPARRRIFLKHLVKAGCIADPARPARTPRESCAIRATRAICEDDDSRRLGALEALP